MVTAIWAAILLAIPLVTWFTRHITMRVMADIMKGIDRYLPQPMSNICYAHEVPNPDLPMSIQMGPANRQNWGGKETTAA